MMDFREAYLELLARQLLGVLDEDPAMDPWTTGFDAEKRRRGLDWPSRALTMIGRSRLLNIRWAVEKVMAEGVPGDYVETGVWRGGSCLFARMVMDATEGGDDRAVWACDSFKGLPKPTDMPDRGDRHHEFSQLAVPQETVEAYFNRYDMLDGFMGDVNFVKGWFHESLPAAPIEKIAVLRLDGDMYDSTRAALVALYDRVSPGGFVIVDDYHAIRGCRIAVDEFRSGRMANSLEQIDGVGVLWVKGDGHDPL